MKNVFLLTLVSVVLLSCASRNGADQLLMEGRKQLMDKEYAQAVNSLCSAESAAPKEKVSPARLGEIRRLLGQSYEANGDGANAISMLLASVKAYEAAGMSANARQSLYEAGLAYYKLRDYTQAGQALRTVINNSREAADTLMEATALGTYAALCLDQDQPNPTLALGLLGRIGKELGCPLSSSELALLAYCNSILGKSKETEQCLRQVAKEFLSVRENEDARDRELQMGYLLSQQASSQAKLQAARLRTFLILALLLAVLFSFIGFFRTQKIAAEQILLREREETEKYMSLAEELKARLKSSSRMDLLERLCENYYIYEGTDNLQPKLLGEVKSVISDFRENPKTFGELERNLNLRQDGIVAKFKAQIPRLKEDDIRIFVFAASGLSSTAISTLLGIEKPVVYNRVYRLKGRIDKAEAPDKALFLEALNA